MTIDEVIGYEKKCSERSDTFVGYTTEEHKQIAEWLEELKFIRQWKADIMEGFCKYDASSFEEIVYNARKKVIDDCKTYIGLHRKYAEHSIDDYVNYLQMASWLNNKIAEQINSK